MNDAEEAAYVLGSKAAWLHMLLACLKSLGYSNTDAARVRWVVERAETVAKLRDLCSVWGDNDWSDDLHLADVIEKHLFRQVNAEIEGR